MNNTLAVVERVNAPDMALCKQLSVLMAVVWGMEEADLLPPWKFFVTPRTGGELIVARAGNAAVAYALLSYASRNEVPFLYMDMVAVHPDVQSQKLGQQMILLAKASAAARSIGSIEWTYDPLEGANANLYIRKLGGIGLQYFHNYYGELSGRSHIGTPTDRLWVALPIRGAEHPAPRTDTLPELTFSTSIRPSLVSQDTPLPPLVGVSVPRAFAQIRDHDREHAVRIREASRLLFEHFVNQRHYHVTNLLVTNEQNVYVLTRN